MPEGRLYTRILGALPEWFVGIFTLFTGATNKRIKKILIGLKKRGWEILILSSRMRYFQKKSERWLKKSEIPYDEIICVGPFFRRTKKFKVLKEEGVDVLIDDDTVLRHYLRRRAFVSLPPEKFIQLSQAVF